MDILGVDGVDVFIPVQCSENTFNKRYIVNLFMLYLFILSLLLFIYHDYLKSLNLKLRCRKRKGTADLATHKEEYGLTCYK